MHKAITLISLLILNFSVLAQTGEIEGQVINKNKEAIQDVSVKIVNHSAGASTNIDGIFHISSIKEGNYTLSVSRLGYASTTISIKVSANSTTTVPPIILQQAGSNLDEVTINDLTPNKFNRGQSITVSKMPLKDIENPQVYNSISNILLKEQNVTNFDDALKNAPGIDKLWESTGRGGDGAGYFSIRGFAVQPTMVNGLPALTNGSPDIANVESIEVIKGPSGTLYGSSLISYGGLININTKRPYNGFGGNISYTTASYGLNRITADVNTMLSTERNIAFRLNTAYHTQGSFQDAGFKKSLFVAPSLSYEVNDKLSFFVNTEFYQGKSTNQPMLFVDRGSPLRVHNIEELGYDKKRSYTGNDLYMETPTFSLQGQMHYKFSDNWTSQTVFSSTSAKSDGYYSYLYEITTPAERLTGTTLTSGIILSRSTSKQNSETTGSDIQQNFLGNFNIGKIKNKVLIGLDYFNRNETGNSTGYGNQGFVYLGNNLAQFQAIAPALHAYYNSPSNNNTLDPTKTTDDTGILTQAGADAGIAGLDIPGSSYSKSKQEIYSAYVSDVITLFPQLSAMASLRIDHFDNNSYTQTTLSPKFGLVYQPILDKVSIFGNYMNGFQNVAPITIATTGTVLNFDPEQANQYEFGTKLNLLNDKLSATFSYYNIKVSDIVLNVAQDVYSQGGKQLSKGFEGSVIASPVSGLNLITGYSYNDSKLTAGDADFEGKRPESAGPKHMVNLWTSYKFLKGDLNGIGVGFGGNYASENEIFNRTVGGTFTLPKYTLINASTFYEASSFRIALKLDNITNKDYYKGWSTISPQAARTFSANFTYNF
ncbi:Ferrichrome-iron receptor [Arcticibacter svalbardensis MN12-7]|uniref:Ferrichrome-iron receptor n=1 Tax=Arcticibacter svalbardensis MN12-7 TaxID=1150600 RepID=R9GUL2_9SPHI|nr:TonB-dependent receptor [Arcticibacter svalbardensis]EOR95185.1 Ferrichrome-iron receptor [Arcticibacter svalbardensis MN12-7]